MRRLLRSAVLVLSSIAVACGSQAPGSAAQDVPEPPDVFQKLGLPPGLPVRWIEAGADGSGGLREYFEDILDTHRAGADVDITTRGHLVLVRDAKAASGRYELTEFHIQTTRSGETQLDETVKSSGALAIETVAGTKGPLTVYRLDGGSSPERARVFVRFGNALTVPAPELVETAADAGYSLARLATATADGIEITEQIHDLLNHKVRLHVGQDLVARLNPDGGQFTWTLRGGSEGTQLRLESSGEEAGMQMFRLKAVAPGWTDLIFESNGLPNTMRVKVEP